MKKFDKKIQSKIINIILIIAWMGIVFGFSNQGGTKSGNTSRKVTVTVVQAVSNKTIEENEQIIEISEKIIRKMAHYTIYMVGGCLIINYAYTTSQNTKKKILYSTIFGACYAITDEIHQYFVPGRSARLFDVGIDILGVITGIFIYLALITMIDKLSQKYGRKLLDDA